MINAEEFLEVMRCFPTGVTVVTTRSADGKAYGVTVNSFTSVSLKPALVLVCLDRNLSGLSTFRESGLLAINLLGEEQEDLSIHFSRKGRAFSRGSYEADKTELPLLKGALGYLECRIVSEQQAGDHVILLAEVLSSSSGGDQTRLPLIFFRGRYPRLNS